MPNSHTKQLCFPTKASWHAKQTFETALFMGQGKGNRRRRGPWKLLGKPLGLIDGPVLSDGPVLAQALPLAMGLGLGDGLTLVDGVPLADLIGLSEA